MEALAENWKFLLIVLMAALIFGVAIAFIAMHVFGHGGHRRADGVERHESGKHRR